MKTTFAWQIMLALLIQISSGLYPSSSGNFMMIILTSCLSPVISAKGHGSGGGNGSTKEEEGENEEEANKFVAQYDPDIVIQVWMLGSADTYTQSTSDLCPVPFCTIERLLDESEFTLATSDGDH